ncbi:MATH and LRR domain-containing protein PFE0570w [Vigna unguiculata]|uniref:MATH and LRR domain-containing protein PFE0570w n=1 Tax=Vigna unguiculata TaxID=3917 RepID=UPI0010160CD5|nr:MATH and LRR domain-containing protein PFE0570w [Vigna unguiculata]
MEPFAGEECHSSESGWTMYIGSPMDDAGHTDDAADNDHQAVQTDPQNADDDDDEDEDESDDDSMASDASSGPSHLHGFPEFFQRDAEEECDAAKCCLEKKPNKTQHKQMEGKKVENKGMLFVATKGKSPVQGCTNVKKRNFVGKRK